MNNENNVLLIQELIGEAAVYEQLAEECTELAKEALKMARILRNENPTPIKKEQVEKNLSEEFTDVFLCASDLGIHFDYRDLIYKDDRWRNRIQAEKWKKKFKDMEN